jgi:4'-phosphopantetheinyl transferase
MNQPEEMKLKYFYMLWTLKESYIKMEGKGLSIPLNSFTIRIEDNDISVTVDNEIREFHFYQSFLDGDAIYAICTLSSNILKSTYWNIESFLKKCKIMF